MNRNFSVQSALLAPQMQSFVNNMGLTIKPVGFSLSTGNVAYAGPEGETRESVVLHEPLVLSPGENVSAADIQRMRDRFEIHPLRVILGPGKDESVQRFLSVWSDMQTAFFRDKGTADRVREKQEALSGADRMLADAMIAENQAFSAGPNRSSHRAAVLYRDYVNESGAAGSLHRHMVSRATLNALSAGALGLASDLLGMSAEIYEGGKGINLAIAAEERMRAALASVMAGSPLEGVVGHIDRALMGWKITRDIKSGKVDEGLILGADRLSGLGRRLSELSIIRGAEDFAGLGPKDGSYVFVEHEDNTLELRLASGEVPHKVLVHPEMDSLVAAGNWMIRNGVFVFDNSSEDFAVGRESVEDASRDSGVRFSVNGGLDPLRNFLKGTKVRFAIKA